MTDAIQFKAQQLPQGTILNHQYLIRSLLGQGGFGITYLCYDQLNNLQVAIKEYFPSDYVIRKELDMLPASDKAQDAVIRGLEYFFDEVKVLMEFNQHPNIVKITDYFFENQTMYFVMEYLSGISLKDYLEQEGGRIGFGDTWRILKPVMLALNEVHQAKLLHRDIAPDNIYLCNDGNTKILDFGSARLALSSGTLGTSLTLKPGYAPIEQYRNYGQQGPWTDVYQLGAVFYRSLTGRLPADSLEREADDVLESPVQLGAALSDPADRAIMKALSLSPEDRFQSFAKMIDAFEIPEASSEINPKDALFFKEAKESTRPGDLTGREFVQPEERSIQIRNWLVILMLGIIVAVILYFMID